MNFILLIKIIEINIIVLFNIEKERGYDEACLNLVNHLLLTLRV